MRWRVRNEDGLAFFFSKEFRVQFFKLFFFFVFLSFLILFSSSDSFFFIDIKSMFIRKRLRK